MPCYELSKCPSYADQIHKNGTDTYLREAIPSKNSVQTMIINIRMVQILWRGNTVEDLNTYDSYIHKNGSDTLER